VASLSAVVEGSAILTLRHRSGRKVAARIVRRGVAPIGVAQTRDLDLLLINGAKGSRRTEELVARTLRSMAARIRRRENGAPTSPQALAEMAAPPSTYC
jgi:hypothetical protein